MRVDSAMAYIPKQTSNMNTGYRNSQTQVVARKGQVPHINTSADPNLAAAKRIPATPAASAPPNTNNMPMLTMEGMVAAFGTNDSAYDLNADGIVDINDFSQFLLNGGTGYHSEAAITAEGIEMNLGSTNAAYDLDGNGIVGLSDFSQFLVNYGQSTQELSATAMQNTVTAGASPSLTQSATQPLSMRGSSLFGQQALQLYQQLWNHSGNMPPRQLLSGA